MFKHVAPVIPTILLASCAFGEVAGDASDMDAGAEVRLHVADPEPGWRQPDAVPVELGPDAAVPPSEKPIAEPCTPATSRLIDCLAADCPAVAPIRDGLADIIRGECEDDLAAGSLARADVAALAAGDGCDGLMAAVVDEARDGMLWSLCEDGPVVALETCEASCRRLETCEPGDAESGESAADAADQDAADQDPACVAECATDECMAPAYRCFAEADCSALASCFDIYQECWSGGL